MSGKDPNPYLLTLPSLISAKKKLSRVAKNYENYSLKAFESQTLTPTQFRQQLIRNFNVKVDDSELGALVSLFDTDGDHTVDSMQFISQFLRMGKTEKQKDLKHKNERMNEIAKLKKAIEDRMEEKCKKDEDAQVASTWTAEDEDSAIAKLTRAAFCYDPNSSALDAYNKLEYVDGAELRKQFMLSFNTKFTLEETAALVNLFGDLENKIIYCREFLNNFHRIRRNELDRHAHLHSMVTEEIHAHQAHLQEKKIEKLKNLTVAKVRPFTEEDKTSAIEKLRFAATYRRPNPFVKEIDKSFEALHLSHTEFKEMLKNNLFVRLTPAELDALVSVFDRKHDGTISCPDFIATFYRIAINENRRILREKRERTEYLRRKEIERKAKRVQDAIALVTTHVEWPDLPSAEDSSSLNSLSEHGGSIYDGTSLNGSNVSLSLASSTTLKSKKKKSKRPSVGMILSPNKAASRLAKSDASLTQLFPQASEDTKNFILEIGTQLIFILTYSFLKIHVCRGARSAHRENEAHKICDEERGCNY